MGCAVGCFAPLPPVLVNPRIQFRQRHLLVRQTEKEKEKERDRLAYRIEQKCVYFSGSSSSINGHGAEVLRNVADVLLSYPELQLTLVSRGGHKCGGNSSSSKRGCRMAQTRAEMCKERLLELGVLSDLHIECCVCPDEEYEEFFTGNETKRTFDRWSPKCSSAKCSSGRQKTDTYSYNNNNDNKKLSARDDRRFGTVSFRSSHPQLLPPQQRLDYLLSRTGFDFLSHSAELSERGLHTVAIIALVLREATRPMVITVPKQSAPLFYQRAEVIAKAIKEQAVGSEVLVVVASQDEQVATVQILEADGSEFGVEEEFGPQSRLVEILQETPLAFRPNSSELVPEVLPAIRQCADVLKGLHRTTVLVEAYSGPKRPGVSEAWVREIMLLRAERVASWLRAEGVGIPIIARGSAGLQPGTDEKKANNNDNNNNQNNNNNDDICWEHSNNNCAGSAAVVLTLIDHAEELVHLQATDVDDACHVCVGDPHALTCNVPVTARPTETGCVLTWGST